MKGCWWIWWVKTVLELAICSGGCWFHVCAKLWANKCEAKQVKQVSEAVRNISVTLSRITRKFQITGRPMDRFLLTNFQFIACFYHTSFSQMLRKEGVSDLARLLHLLSSDGQEINLPSKTLKAKTRLISAEEWMKYRIYPKVKSIFSVCTTEKWFVLSEIRMNNWNICIWFFPPLLLKGA